MKNAVSIGANFSPNVGANFPLKLATNGKGNYVGVKKRKTEGGDGNVGPNQWEKTKIRSKRKHATQQRKEKNGENWKKIEDKKW